jgi:hypothetical protein
MDRLLDDRAVGQEEHLVEHDRFAEVGDEATRRGRTLLP